MQGGPRSVFEANAGAGRPLAPRETSLTIRSGPPGVSLELRRGGVAALIRVNVVGESTLLRGTGRGGQGEVALTLDHADRGGMLEAGPIERTNTVAALEADAPRIRVSAR